MLEGPELVGYHVQLLDGAGQQQGGGGGAGFGCSRCLVVDYLPAQVCSGSCVGMGGREGGWWVASWVE